MRTRLTLGVIWCCFLARAFFYCAAIPLWEGYDEFSHFALIQSVATHHGGLPLAATPPNSSRTVGESRKLTPSAWILRDLASGILSYEEYFDLRSAERSSRRTRLEQMPVEWSRQEADPPEPMYEAQQPPLYYWIMAPLYGAMQGWSLPHAVLMLRLLTALLASSAIPLAFLVGRRIASGDDTIALAAALVAASFPQFLILTGHLSNEGLSVLAGGAFVLLALRIADGEPSPWGGVLLGGALGAALLTKAYFLALVPLAVVVLWQARRRGTARRAQQQAMLATFLCLAIAGWWHVRNMLVTGTITGQFEDAQAMRNSAVSLLDAARRIRWRGVFDFMAISYIWLGGWSFLVTRSWMYRVAEFMAVLAGAGLCAQMLRSRKELPAPRALVLLVLPYLSMVAGLCFHAAQVFRVRGSGATVGYYLYALVVPEAILIVVGFARLVPQRWRMLPLVVAVVILQGIEQFGAWILMFPYYAGMIRHAADGSLRAARLGQYANGGIQIMMEHLSGIAPLGSPLAMRAAAAGDLFATVLLVWCAWWIAVSDSGNSRPR